MSDQHKQGRWTYTAEPVTVGPNTQNVRSLTSGDRKKFALKSKEIKEGKFQANDLPFLIASLGCVDPAVSVEEAEEMPPALLDACVEKIMELTGFSDEKKEPPAPVILAGQPPATETPQPS